MQVVSRDVIWLLSHIRVISSEPPEYARATATSAVDIGAFTLCSQHNRLARSGPSVESPTPSTAIAGRRPSEIRHGDGPTPSHASIVNIAEPQ